MTGALLRRYLSDRLAMIAAFYVVAGLILLLFGLLLGYEGVSGALVWRNAGYGLVLTTLVAGLYCTYDLMRWWPFARQMARLQSGKPDLAALANLPDGATAEQEAFRDVLGMPSLWRPTLAVVLVYLFLYGSYFLVTRRTYARAILPTN